MSDGLQGPPGFAGAHEWSTDNVDNFFRANANPISGGGLPFPWTYSSMDTGTLQIASNLCTQVETTNVDARFRASTILSSSNHFCQVTLAAPTLGAGALEMWALCRVDPSVETFYMGGISAGPANVAANWTAQINKCVTGTTTQIGSSGPAFTAVPKAGDRIKLTVNGTTITVYYNDIQQTTVTDSAITTGVRCGLGMTNHAATSLGAFRELRYNVL